MPGASKPKPKGRQCARCHGWYRPNRWRSAGPMLEYCSIKCMKKAHAESIIQQEIARDW